MTTKLPESFVRKGLDLAKGAQFMGHPLEQFSRDELIAVAAMGWDDSRRKTLDAMKMLDTFDTPKNSA